MDIDTSGPNQAATSGDSGEVTRAEGLWFEDCGLIIQAENTIFRISRDFLAIQSPIFHDMLSLPAPGDADMRDGCPFVRLPDAAVDVTVFLKALIYHDFFEPAPSPTTMEILTGVLRMSHKYEVDSLRKRALIHISRFHPTGLLDWEQLDDEASPWFQELLGQTGPSFLPIIILARQLSIDWILPTAFYRVCRYTSEEILIAGFTSLDLDTTDKILCVAASRMLETTSVTEMLEFLWSPQVIDGCGSPATCFTSRFLTRRLAEDWRKRASDIAPLMPLDVWMGNDWDHLEVCDSCLSTMKTTHRQAKELFWNKLPKMFGLPDWVELEKRKAEALD